MSRNTRSERGGREKWNENIRRQESKSEEENIRKVLSQIKQPRELRRRSEATSRAFCVCRNNSKTHQASTIPQQDLDRKLQQERENLNHHSSRMYSHVCLLNKWPNLTGAASHGRVFSSSSRALSVEMQQKQWQRNDKSVDTSEHENSWLLSRKCIHEVCFVISENTL